MGVGWGDGGKWGKNPVRALHGGIWYSEKLSSCMVALSQLKNLKFHT